MTCKQPRRWWADPSQASTCAEFIKRCENIHQVSPHPLHARQLSFALTSLPPAGASQRPSGAPLGSFFLSGPASSGKTSDCFPGPMSAPPLQERPQTASPAPRRPRSSFFTGLGNTWGPRARDPAAAGAFTRRLNQRGDRDLQPAKVNSSALQFVLIRSEELKPRRDDLPFLSEETIILVTPQTENKDIFVQWAGKQQELCKN